MYMVSFVSTTRSLAKEMERKPSCSKVEIKKGPWTSHEDKILKDYVRIHGEVKWSDLAQKTGLKRCGKSCRFRWLNYLRPDIKLGNISEDEEDLIIRLHRLLGNRWTLIAGRLPGRSGNEIKNYWKTTLIKKLLAQKNQHKLDAKLEEEKSGHEPQLTATSSTTTVTPAMQLTDPNSSGQQCGDQFQHHNKGTSFWEYNGNISSLGDDRMRLCVNSEIGDRDSEDMGGLGHDGFSSDNYSEAP